MSTWQRGAEDGYSLTINYNRTEYPDLSSALMAAFEQLGNDARASNPKPETPTFEDLRARVEAHPDYAALQTDLTAADIEVQAAVVRRRKLSERMDTLWSREAAAVGYVGQQR